MTTVFITNTMTSGAGQRRLPDEIDGTPFKANWLDEMGNNVTNGSNFISVQLKSGETRKFVSTGESFHWKQVLRLSRQFQRDSRQRDVHQLGDSGNRLAEAGCLWPFHS